MSNENKPSNDLAVRRPTSSTASSGARHDPGRTTPTALQEERVGGVSTQSLAYPLLAQSADFAICALDVLQVSYVAAERLRQAAQSLSALARVKPREQVVVAELSTRCRTCVEQAREALVAARQEAIDSLVQSVKPALQAPFRERLEANASFIEGLDAIIPLGYSLESASKALADVFDRGHRYELCGRFLQMTDAYAAQTEALLHQLLHRHEQATEESPIPMYEEDDFPHDT